MLKERNPELYTAIKAFSVEALRCVENALRSGVRLSVFMENTWQVGDQDNVFIRRQEEVPQYWSLLHKANQEISELPTLKRARELAMADAIWGNQLDQMVGTLQSSHRISIDSTLTSPAVHSLSKTNSPELSELYFDEQVERLERFFKQPEFEYIQTTPLYGLRVVNIVNISENVSLEPLSNKQIIELLEVGVIQPQTIGPRLNEIIHNPPSAAIIIRFKLPKIVGEITRTPEDFDYIRNLFDNLSITEALLVDLLTLNFDSPIRPAGNLKREDSPFVTSRNINKYEITNGWAITPQEFTDDDQNKVITLWPLLNDGSKKCIHWLTLAIRRFSLALNRPSLDDRLIDLMICAESIFLRVEQGELTYKLSHRAALILGKNASEQKEIFKFFGKAYAMRSVVVHGAKSFTRSHKDAEELAQITKALVDYLRAAISHMLTLAMNPHASGELINWKDLMFQDGPPDHKT